jgi:hypothetical protein
MSLKSVFSLQGFWIGGGQKNHHRSLALIIPAPIVREFNLSPETILALRINQETRKMTLEVMRAETEMVAENVSS